MKNTSIVAAIDFSDSSALVLRHAAHVCGLNGGQLTAVHVVPSSRLQHWKESLARQSHDHDLSAVEGELGDFVDEVLHEADVDTVIVEGRPAEEIKSIVAELEADLLVIAANDMTKTRLGTISARCVRTVGCDVLVLRDWQGGEFQKILSCTDFSRISGEALRRAAGFAKLYGAQLEVVHVMFPPDKDSWGRVREQPLAEEESYSASCIKKAEENMSEFVETFCDGFGPGEVKTTVLSSELPSAELTHYVKNSGSDLVVIGTTRLSDLESIFLGTNAERLLQDSPVSVLAVRA